jgi:hypothetical protein
VARSMILIQTRNLPMAAIKSLTRSWRLKEDVPKPFTRMPADWCGPLQRSGNFTKGRRFVLVRLSGIWVRFRGGVMRERLPNRVKGQAWHDALSTPDLPQIAAEAVALPEVFSPVQVQTRAAQQKLRA